MYYVPGFGEHFCLGFLFLWFLQIAFLISGKFGVWVQRGLYILNHVHIRIDDTWK